MSWIFFKFSIHLAYHENLKFKISGSCDLWRQLSTRPIGNNFFINQDIYVNAILLLATYRSKIYYQIFKILFIKYAQIIF